MFLQPVGMRSEKMQHKRTKLKLTVGLLLIIAISLAMSAPALATLDYGAVGFDENVTGQRGSFCYSLVDSNAPASIHLNSVYLYKDPDNYLEFGWMWNSVQGLHWFVYCIDYGVLVDNRFINVGAPTAGQEFGLKVVSDGVNNTWFRAYAKRDGIDWEKYNWLFTIMKSGRASVGTERSTVNDSNYARWRVCQRLANTSGATWQYFSSPYENPAASSPDHDPGYHGYKATNYNLYSLKN
ncbi:MAG: hypothetical protein COW32_08545 [Candidatus Aquicultor secundus]|uniref:Uncharacterized protein n=2 Tax=Candidatus Aquicultor secundus TaxID=1973895 RepID=A0A2M7T562_9ACTN|nr:MAG: hypothetical protein COW32_08545 [Candidatus Aquicultor secundus]PIX53176.1 MAG: hypothetical protein COZ51_00120 [Candidatus Aquicultor secundus]PIY40862.1 MAG: hypothetical protein COZ03_03305 [Candidatus Aquicultor secundus]PIZ35053.1 MAG: hypothetical protein COY37_11065 [Candidatus Aquicultor secundus]